MRKVIKEMAYSIFSLKKLTQSKEQNAAITIQESVKIIQTSKQPIGVHGFFNMNSYYLPFSLIKGLHILTIKDNCRV